MNNVWIKNPKVPGHYWCRGEKRSNLAIAHVGERVVWDAATNANVSQGWWAQIVPGGVALPLESLSNYEFCGPIPLP